MKKSVSSIIVLTLAAGVLATASTALAAGAFGGGGFGGGHVGGFSGGHVGGFGGGHVGVAVPNGAGFAAGRAGGFAAGRVNGVAGAVNFGAPRVPGGHFAGGHYWHGHRVWIGGGWGPGYGAGYGWPYAYAYDDYADYPYGADTGTYSYDETAPGIYYGNANGRLLTGRSAATGEGGNYCATPVKTCQLYHMSIVGGGCSCKVAGGRAHGSVTQ